MAKALPPRPDWLPLLYFVGLMFACNLAVYWMPTWGRAAYGAWIAVGVALVVHAGVEPGLPKTMLGNVRRILRAHVWPLYTR